MPVFSFEVTIYILILINNRFESDMLAFSGCYFGGGDKERRELEQIRKRWETLHVI